MTNFEKTAIITELLPNEFEMLEAQEVEQFQKHSMKDLDKVLDTIQMTPKEIARLKLIIESSK